MNRQSRKYWSLVLIASMLAPGCAPQQPFYAREDGNLSHYLGVATEIDYPDSQESPSCCHRRSFIYANPLSVL